MKLIIKIKIRTNSCYSNNYFNFKTYVVHVQVPANEPVEAQYKKFVLSHDELDEQEVLYNCKFAFYLEQIIKICLK
jgi:hypothetical protein